MLKVTKSGKKWMVLMRTKRYRAILQQDCSIDFPDKMAKWLDFDF
jgi:hypothetical protein